MIPAVAADTPVAEHVRKFASDLPLLDTVEKIQAAVAVPTIVLPDPPAPRTIPIAQNSIIGKALTESWKIRSDTMQQVEDAFTEHTQKMFMQVLPAADHHKDTKLGVTLDEKGQAQFTVLVWD